MSEGLRINCGCGEFYQPGWTNTDVVATDTVRPDVLVSSAVPFPFPDESADAILLGHMLEHVPEANVGGLLAQVMRVLRPGAQVLVIGPDVLRCLDLWKRGETTHERLWAQLENPDAGNAEWPEARHYWNCYEARVVDMLTSAGFTSITPLPIEPASFAAWPVVDAHAQDQCAVLATKPLDA